MYAYIYTDSKNIHVEIPKIYAPDLKKGTNTTRICPMYEKKPHQIVFFYTSSNHEAQWLQSDICGFY